MSTEPAIEIVSFRIDPTNEGAMLAARPVAIAAIAAACEGLLGSELYRGEAPGEWIDVVRWRSLDEAKAAAAVAPTVPAAAAYFGCITSPPHMLHGTLSQADGGEAG
jgi:hypothetical protein